MRELFVVLLLYLSACSSLRGDHSLLISAGTEMNLIEPSRLGREISSTHEVKVLHDEKESTFIGRLEVDAQKILLVGLAPTYTRLFTLKFERGEASFESTVTMPLPFDPRHILADIQLALWPLSPLKEQVDVREENGRVILNDEGTPVIRITYPYATRDEFEFVHLERGYSIRVRNLPQEG